MFKGFRGVLGVTYIVLDVSLIISYYFIKKAMQDQLAMGTRKDLNWMYFMLVLIFTLSTLYILIFGQKASWLYATEHELELVITPLLDAAIIILILMLQNKNFGFATKQPVEVECNVSDEDEVEEVNRSDLQVRLTNFGQSITAPEGEDHEFDSRGSSFQVNQLLSSQQRQSILNESGRAS